MLSEQLPLPPHSSEDHLLADVAAVTGLFAPERIWQAEMLLDNLEEQPDKAPADSATLA